MPDVEHEQLPAGGPWTRHGYEIPGITVAGPGRPPMVRCMGLQGCDLCQFDAAQIRKEHRQHAESMARVTAELEALLGQQPDEEPMPDGGPCPLCGRQVARVLLEGHLQKHKLDLVRIRQHPLYQAISVVVRAHTTVRTPTGPISACACGQLDLGRSWSEHVADLLLPALLDHLPTIRTSEDSPRWALVATLEAIGTEPPSLTADPLEVEHGARARFVQRLLERSGEELEAGTLRLPDGDELEVLTRVQVVSWLEGVVARLRGGEDL